MEFLTLCEDMMQIGHALNVCSSDILLASDNSVYLATETLKCISII
jgi:hypothetical protein